MTSDGSSEDGRTQRFMLDLMSLLKKNLEKNYLDKMKQDPEYVETK